jgi:hypothetical protein
MGTLWVQGHENLFRAPWQSVRPNYQSPLVYKLYLYGGLCPNYFLKELGFGGFVFMFKVLYLQYTRFKGICFSS